MSLQIPKEHQKGLAKILSLSADHATEFLKNIELAAKKTRSDRVASFDLRDIPGISHKDLDKMLDTVLALYHVRNHAEVSTEEFISDVIDSLREDDSKFETGTIQATRKRLTDFLSLDSLNVWAKAAVLRYEHERTVHDLRILTDARPVFGEEVSVKPHAAVVFHMLKIAYHASKGVEEIYFSLDEDDLEYLKQAIVRAEKKAKSLRDALADADINTINPS